MIRLSKDWPVLLAGAIQRGLKSHETHSIVNYIEQVVEAPGNKKIEILGALVSELETRERRDGTGRRVFPIS